jgi:hypothetical protein
MLRGSLDGVSHDRVSGWAADTTVPDDVVEISIFVNGRKAAQIKCDQYRADLKEAGYGQGRHGFRYDFTTKLDDASNKRIEARFAETGAPLGNGKVILSKAGVASLGSLEARPGGVLGRLPASLPAPTTQRALFEMLALVEPEYGIYDLLSRFDLDGWTTRDVGNAVYGKRTKMQRSEGDQSSASVRDYFNETLFSDEFQRSIISGLLDAYAEKRRLLFVHIPKCAGSDLSKNLRSRYPSLEQRLTEPEWTTSDQLFKTLREFVEIAKFSDTVFLRGHITLDFYLENKLARSSDRLFSIMRDPIQIALSSANYVTMRIRQDFDRQRLEPDTKRWLKFLGFDTLPTEVSEDFAAEICMRILRNENIVGPNSMCHWLGGGDAQTVLERLAEHHVELTDTTRYSDWLRERWGIASSTRENESIKFITEESLKPQDLNYLREISSEDLKLYVALQNSLEEADRAWVIGPELLL